MSVKNGLQRTAKLAWIPLAFVLAVVSANGQTPSPFTLRPYETVVSNPDSDQVWHDLMDLILHLLINKLNCGSPTIPDDVPVAMLVVVDCFASGGLVAMTAAEKEEFMITLDAAEEAMRDTPDSVPLITKLKFESTLKLMRVEVLVQP
jgi:hypothetical protein